LDTDGDGSADIVEMVFGSNPANASSTPEDRLVDMFVGTFACGDGLDNDGDTLVDGADLGCVDSDSDAVSDPVESSAGSDPNDSSSFPENASIDAALNALGYPWPFCSDGWDNDLDGLTDGADPGCVPQDTDGDGFDDITEISLGSDPNSPGSIPEHFSYPATCTDSVDNDLDGQIDLADWGCQIGPDDDFDGFSDRVELASGSDPLDPTSVPEVDFFNPGACSNSADDDGDGLVDLADPSCAIFAPTSANVAVVPNFVGFGGVGPLDPADFPSYAFTEVSPGSVSSKADLAPYDTVIFWQFCDVGSPANATFRSALLDWLDDGHKLIIWDSDSCNVPDGTAADYSWLSAVSAEFETDSPGQLGALCPGPPNPCGVAVVEENHLSSSDPVSPFYIDTETMARTTDAVGDLNAIIAKSRNWCADMEGTNINGASGPAHAYTKPGKIANGGMIIYNGLDYDYQSAELIKTLELELAHGWGPAGNAAVADLLCQVPVGELQPPSATNVIGTAHTLTLTIKQALQPVPGVPVTFVVISGPCKDQTGSDVTDANGQASWTYTCMAVGTDMIVARWVIDGEQFESKYPAEKEWIRPPNQPPDCSAAAPSISEIWPPNHKMVGVNILGVTDPEGDPISIVITGITQDEPLNGLGDGDTSPDGAGVDTDTAQVRAERAGTPKVPGNGRVYHIHFEASDDKDAVCSGVVKVGVPHDQRPRHVIVDGGELYDSTMP
jgi:hypothetical protein